MNETSNNDFLSYRDALFYAIEKAAGYKAATTRGFMRLSADIHLRTGKTVGVSTLKRLTGYIDGLGVPRTGTLDTLAQFAGYANFEAFKYANSKGLSSESGFLSTRTLRTSELAAGAIIRLIWQPGRICVCRYRGDDAFVVLRSVCTRLIAGTTFRCSIFIQGEMLFLDHVLLPGSNEPRPYKAGGTNGIQIEVLTD